MSRLKAACTPQSWAVLARMSSLEHGFAGAQHPVCNIASKPSRNPAGQAGSRTADMQGLPPQVVAWAADEAEHTGV